MRPTDAVLEEEVFFCIYLAVRPTDAVLEEEVFFCIYLAVRRTEAVLEEEVFFLNLFSGATDGRSFGRRSFFFEFI